MSGVQIPSLTLQARAWKNRKRAVFSGLFRFLVLCVTSDASDSLFQTAQPSDQFYLSNYSESVRNAATDVLLNLTNQSHEEHLVFNTRCRRWKRGELAQITRWRCWLRPFRDA